MNEIDPSQMPHDYDAERRVIGSMLLDPVDIPAIVSKVSVQDFWFQPFIAVYGAAADLSMSNKPVTLETVARKLAETKSATGGRSALEELGGHNKLVEFIQGVAPEEWNFWADRVSAVAERRELLIYFSQARREIMDSTGDVANLRSKLEESLVGVRRTEVDGTTTVSLAEAADSLRDRIDRYINDPHSITGLETGWKVFDRLLDGLQPGNVTIVYAPSSRYKSLFVQNLGLRASQLGAPGLWFTTEMPYVQVAERLLQLESGLNLRWLRRDGKIREHSDRIERARKRLGDYPIHICDRSVDIGYIKAEVMRRKRWDGVEYVIVDLVDQVSTASYKDDTISQQSSIMKAMKELAKTAQVHIVLVSHISKTERALRNRPDLDVEDMKGSSSKYQDVDTAISIMPVREEVSQQTGMKEWVGMDRLQIQEAAKDGGMTILVSVTKNRHGELDRIPFDMDWLRGGRMEPLFKPLERQVSLSEGLQQELAEDEAMLADDTDEGTGNN